MKIFIDTADVDEIKALVSTGLVDGVTTNPTLMARAGRRVCEVVTEICELVNGPVSAEVASDDFATMLKEGRVLHGLAPNIAIKVPATLDGLKACRVLVEEGAMVNVTLCFSQGQAILAAKAGATFVSPFVGRLDDVAIDGMQLVDDIVRIYRNFDRFETEVLVASVRLASHVVAAARIGADVVTMPPAVFRQLFDHPLTDQGMRKFREDWEKSGLKILGK